ncbi:aminopeptidase N-like [Chironomus tepperi]|uniref:aminopeptidase N-like n=1 Tax=Chironomus tepperi TaxID=113505 RepID=UPI00391F279F
MRPNNARKLFPCFDEPASKAPFLVSISRPKGYTTLFNTPLSRSEAIDENNVLDHFQITPPMSTFTFGFLISQLTVVEKSDYLQDPHIKNVCIKVYARSELHADLINTRIHERIEKTFLAIRSYFGEDYPLTKLDIVALPNYSTVKPADNWGLIVYKESELNQNTYYLIAQELAYQWVGALISPYWWTDFHINKAITGFIAANTALSLNNGNEFDGKWPMTILYSIYYEFSKRYPHSRITGMKQETICSKTELVLRMFNYTMGTETFRKGIQKLFINRKYKTFFTEDVWTLLTEQVHRDNKLDGRDTINAIATSWVQKERLPAVTVTRNYEKRTATLSQKLFLRERPHDVPDQDKMLWWIPVIIVKEDKLDFDDFEPMKWMKKERQVDVSNMPAADKFIIMNPEEIGPFPVNYDERNWNMIANFLQTEKRLLIPINTRAKLLHDAWNLAYAGSLSFATALNMTLFMKNEREHIVWNPVFTMMDHIGKHIDDIQSVHQKFNVYVAQLLIPLFEELSKTEENEERWMKNLRTLSKTFLCRAGYRPCIEEAQKEFKKWMEMENPEEGNPVANQFICPVFRYGTMEEWEFGLKRVMNFPSERRQSERTYLLKTLAGCPNQNEKILRLLNITILEGNENFTENDIFLIFSMLSGNSVGYSTLFKFLEQNWDTIKIKFANKTNLWDNLISTSCGIFTTQRGYDMVSKLYVAKQGEFGSAEHIIDKSLKNIKEEAKWSKENLPVIEKWLDTYFKNSGNSYKDKFVM